LSGGLDAWPAVLRPLVAAAGEKAVREHAASALHYPAEWCHTAEEAKQIRKSMNKEL
jgi:hypothetical protein